MRADLELEGAVDRPSPQSSGEEFLMSTSADPTSGTRSGQTYGSGHHYSGGAVGMLIFAGTLMVLTGVCNWKT